MVVRPRAWCEEGRRYGAAVDAGPAWQLTEAHDWQRAGEGAADAHGSAHGRQVGDPQRVLPLARASGAWVRGRVFWGVDSVGFRRSALAGVAAICPDVPSRTAQRAANADRQRAKHLADARAAGLWQRGQRHAGEGSSARAVPIPARPSPQTQGSQYACRRLPTWLVDACVGDVIAGAAAAEGEVLAVLTVRLEELITAGRLSACMA